MPSAPEELAAAPPVPPPSSETQPVVTPARTRIVERTQPTPADRSGREAEADGARARGRRCSMPGLWTATAGFFTPSISIVAPTAPEASGTGRVVSGTGHEDPHHRRARHGRSRASAAPRAARPLDRHVGPKRGPDRRLPRHGGVRAWPRA